ncbi:hypothetical protein ACFSQ7_30550 [Paenibacillus rhizoplanae]
MTTKHLAIQKVNDHKAIVEYGMSRAEAEEVLGKGGGEGYRQFSHV